MAEGSLTLAAPIGAPAISEALVAVVIPYFQRGEGLLSEALRSVFTQSLLGEGARIHVLVVDDHSPRNPQEDVEGMVVPPGVTLEVTRTPANGGPAAARNCGLDSVSRDTDFVAFLDSDEVWEPRHLENACMAMALTERDVYFANYLRREWARDKFSITGFGEGHHQVDRERQIFRFEGDPLPAILLDAVVRIQTCVVRWPVLQSLRFRRELAIGEDSDYVAAAVVGYGASLCFTRLIETIEEQPGVNVSQNIDGDAKKEVTIRLKMLQYQLHVLRVYGHLGSLLSAAQQAVVEARYNVLQAILATGTGRFSVLSRVRSLFKACSTDAGFLYWALVFAVGAISRRTFGKGRI